MGAQLVSISNINQGQIGCLYEGASELCFQAGWKTAILIRTRAHKKSTQHKQMFPARRALIRTSNHCCDPILCRHPPSDGHLAWQWGFRDAFPYVPLVLENGEGGGVEQAHCALACP